MGERTAGEREAELVRLMTAAMREADRTFERVGGSTRHHVRDCLLPILADHGLVLVTCTDRDADEQKARAAGRREAFEALLKLSKKKIDEWSQARHEADGWRHGQVADEMISDWNEIDAELRALAAKDGGGT